MGQFRISGSTTGNTYVRGEDGNITYFDKDGKKIAQSVFLEQEGVSLKDGKFVRSKSSGEPAKHTVSGSKTGRYYTVDDDGKKHFYAANGDPINETYFYQKENEAIEAAKSKKSGETGKTAKKKSWRGKLGDAAKSFGKGVVKSVTKMFTDENGKFSWKQTLKTAATCAAVVAVGAAVVAAGILTAGAATAIIVGAGIAMGAGNIIKGAVQYGNSETYEDKLAAIETMGEGTGEVGMAILIKRPMAGSLKAVSTASKIGKMEALASGSGRTVASIKGFGAGMKTVIPSPKQAWEGTKNGVETAYDAVRHPVKTTKAAVEARRQKTWERADIKESVDGVRTQEDIAIARQKVQNSKHLSAKQKAKYNKKLDKVTKKAPHEDLAVLRRQAEDPAATPKQKAAAQKKYNEALKRSMDREALEARLNELEPKPTETGEAVKPAEGVETTPKAETAEAAKPAQEAVPNEATVIKERIAKIDKMQENEFNTLISQSELKSPKGVGKLFGKKSEYAKIEARIKSEVKKPEIQAKLLKKLEAKKQLLEDIGNLKKHPKFEEYKELVKRADDEVSLQLLEDRIAKDNGFFTSRTRKAERSQLYREIFKKQHKLNPEKYPDIELRLKTAKEENLIKDAEKEIQDIQNQLKKAERKANPDRVQQELNAAEKRLNAQEKKLTDALEQLDTKKGNDVKAYNEKRDEMLAKINDIRTEIKVKKDMIKSYRDNVQTLSDRGDELKVDLTTKRTVVEQLQKEEATLEGEINTLTERLNKLEGATKFRNLKEKRSMNERKARLKQTTKGRQQSLDELKNDIQSKETEISGIEQDIHNTEASKIYYEDEIAKSEAELAALKEKLGNERKSIGTLLKQKKKLESRISRTEQAIGKKHAKLEELKAKKANKKKIKVLEDELADLRANHERYQYEYEALKTELESKQAELTKAKEKLAKKQEKLKAIHKAGGAFLGGVAGAQAIQNGGEAADSMGGMLAALAMDEGEEVTDEESEEEVIEDAAAEEESIEEESVEEEVIEDVATEEVLEEETAVDSVDETKNDSSSSSDNSSSSPKSGSTGNNGSPTVTDPTGGNNDGNTTVNGDGSDPNVTRRQPVGPPPPRPINEQPDPEEDDDDTITPDGLEFTIDNYINGRDENGNRTEITPAQRMILTKQIEQAQTLDDIALIYSEMRSFKVFNGRKNLRKALKQKRKLIEARVANDNESKIEKRGEKLEKRMNKVEKNNAKYGATPDMNLSGVTQLNTADIINQEVQKPNLFQKFVLGRQNEIDLTPQTGLSESAVAAEFVEDPVPTDVQIQTTNLSTGDSPILAQTDAPPTETVDITPGEESAQNISQVSETETPVETSEKPSVAMVDTDTEDENKHKLDLSDDMFGMA
ncbi:MAG: hypothetical protein LUB59_03525 [Candidatus Gastranaerophilales bacterium]|nr:hypothetical protein [Candidatus Gastranaerophilales bacterium]